MRLVFIGLVAGLFSALFGVGGGILIVPLLVGFAAFGAREATATSLGAIVVTASAGVALYAFHGKVDPGYAALVGVPAIAGALIGADSPAAHLGALPLDALRRVPRGRGRLAPRGMSTTTIILAVCLGLVAGVMSGLLGVGGGLLFVPLLVALGLGQVEAAATSLLAIIPTAAVGAYRQSRYGNLRVRPALVIGVASIVGVEVGVRIATSVPEHLLRRLFGVLLIAVAVQLAWRARASKESYPRPQ